MAGHLSFLTGGCRPSAQEAGGDSILVVPCGSCVEISITACVKEFQICTVGEKVVANIGGSSDYDVLVSGGVNEDQYE